MFPLYMILIKFFCYQVTQEQVVHLISVQDAIFRVVTAILHSGNIEKNREQSTMCLSFFLKIEI
jgi:hypothetical protein